MSKHQTNQYVITTVEIVLNAAQQSKYCVAVNAHFLKLTSSNLNGQIILIKIK